MNKLANNIWSITNNGKLRSFQYRLINHAIITNVNLKQWKIVQSDLCTFCNQEKETIVHLFWECSRVVPIWNQVSEWFDKMDPSLKLNSQNVIFNNVSKNTRHVSNVVILIVKFYLYKARCAHMQPNIFSLIEDILQFQKLEHMGAIVKGKKEHNKTKWEHIITIIRY